MDAGAIAAVAIGLGIIYAGMVGAIVAAFLWEAQEERHLPPEDPESRQPPHSSRA